MNHLDSMLERNRSYAAQQAAAGTLMPSLAGAMGQAKAMIIGCADMRVDPADLLGLAPGEGVVLRNIGGRVTPGLLEELALLGRLAQLVQQAPGTGEFHLIVLHHTDCGITRLAAAPALLAHYFQVPEGELASKAVADPSAAVAIDVAALRSVTALPAAWLLSGLVYDVASGLIDVVVPPSAVRAA